MGVQDASPDSTLVVQQSVRSTLKMEMLMLISEKFLLQQSELI